MGYFAGSSELQVLALQANQEPAVHNAKRLANCSELQGGGYAGLSRQAVIRKNLQFTRTQTA